MEAVADELACAAGLVCGKLARTPACIIRGFAYRPARGTARDLIRPAQRFVSLRYLVAPRLAGRGMGRMPPAAADAGAHQRQLQCKEALWTEHGSSGKPVLSDPELENFPSLDWSQAIARASSPVAKALRAGHDDPGRQRALPRAMPASRECRRRRSARPAGRRRFAAPRTRRQPRHLRRESQHQFHQHLFRGLQVLRLQPRPARIRHLLPTVSNKSRKKPSRPGKWVRPKSASRADFPTACLRSTIATFCAP